MNFRLCPIIYKKKVDEDIFGIYNYLFGHNFLFLPTSFLERLERSESITNIKGLEELVNKNFLVPIRFSHEKYLDSFKDNLKIEIHLMYLLLSQSCNLSCSYCFENLSSDKKIMPWKIAERAIDYFFEISNPERKIIFYGGEPFLNKDVLLKSIEKIREKDKIYLGNKETDISIVTNGTLIDEEIANFMKINRVSVAVSIDGPEDVHNSARSYRSNRGSFYDSLKGYFILKTNGVNTSISCTIGRHNVHLLDKVAFFFIEELKPSSVGFNLLIGGGDVDVREATISLIKAYELLKEKGIYEDRVMRKIEPLLKGEFHLKDCAAYGNQIAVRYDGKVGPCHAFCNLGDFFSGNILEKNFGLDKNIFEKWVKRTSVFLDKCRNCPLIMLCGSGCAFNSQLKYGDFNNIDKDACVHNKILLDYVIDKLWQRKKSN